MVWSRSEEFVRMLQYLCLVKEMCLVHGSRERKKRMQHLELEKMRHK